MRQQIVTSAIVLARTDYQEADRILTMLTPDNGKVRVIAKGVRRPKSKLAGGIELFSVNDITYLPSQRSELHTLISTRLLQNYGDIVKDIKRTMFGYELLKRINRATEDSPEEAFFNLLQISLESLNNLELNIEMIELWFSMQLLRITGHTPNFITDVEGTKLVASEAYTFDHDAMAFRTAADGSFTSNHIKILRLSVAANQPAVLAQVSGAGAVIMTCTGLVHSILGNYVRM